MNKTILGIIAVGIVIGIIVLVSSDKAEAPEQNVTKTSDIEVVSDNSSPGILTPSDIVRVLISGHKIQNNSLTVSVGTTVVFENTDSFEGLPYDAHTVTTGTIDPSGKLGIVGVVPNSGSGVPDGMINASLSKGDKFSYTFSEPGIVTFYVSEHPLIAGQGTVTAVQEAVDDEKVSEIIKMNSLSFAFAPSSLEATVGEKIELDITSVGLHTFTIDEFDVDVRTPHGETTRVSFTPDRAGTFEYYCAIPGHREAGQVGIITISN